MIITEEDPFELEDGSEFLYTNEVYITDKDKYTVNPLLEYLMRISELLSHSAFAESDQHEDFKTFAKTGIHNGAQLTSSQAYLDDQIVKRKRAKNDYDVFVSPEFEVYGEKYRNVTDGHHSLRAALEDGVYPNFIEQSAQENDNIALLNNGDVEGYLEASHNGDDYHNPCTGRASF